MIVSAVVPTHNEEASIGSCLASLLRQRGVEDFEIIVVDGRSGDRTLDVVRSFPELDSRIRILDNPRRYQVYAWNIGCRAARGEYVVLINAHTTYDPRHFATCIETLKRAGADAVGPVQVATGDGPIGQAIAWCMSSPFGVGNARFRFTDREEETDSVFSMFMRRATFERLNGFDERIAFDEDGEFSYRLRSAGGRIVVSPAIAVQYHVRRSLRGLWRQMQCYGYWRRFTRLLHPASIPLRIYAPPALVAALLASVAMVLAPWHALALVIPAAYLGYVLIAALCAVRSVGLGSSLRVPLALGCMHIAYGLGFWRALMTPADRVLLDVRTS